MKMRWIGTLALAVLCACPLRTFAQGSRLTGIAHVAYRVSNLDQEIAFLQKLGFEEAFSSTRNGNTTQIFVKINNRQFIEIYPQTDPSQPLGWMHVCYESHDLNALYNTLVAHGLKPRPVEKAGAGNLISSLMDPEGRVTEFTQYMPGSRHTLDRGKHLGRNRVSDAIAGFELPVPDMAAAMRFYTAGLGFTARDTGTGARIRITNRPLPWILLRPAGTRARPRLFFTVKDTAAAARQLRAAGLRVERRGRRLVVTDPDGNPFVFVSARVHRRRRR